MADTQSILQLGIEAARAGDKAEARELFRLATREDPNNAQGWLWLAGVAEEREEKRSALEHVLRLDPNNDLARKGLAALGGPSAGAAAVGGAAGAAAMASTAALPVQPVSDAGRLPPDSIPASDQDIADAFDSIDDYAAAPESGRARTYSQPDQVGGYVPPDFGDDDYDLSEYQNKPRVTADDIAAQERQREVVVEGEEPRRGIGAWLPALIILGIALAALAFFLLNNRDGRVANDPGRAGASNAAVGSPAPSGFGASPFASDAAGGVAPLPVDPGASAAPGDPLAGASPLPSDPVAGASPLPGDPAAGASPAGGGVVVPVPVDPAAGASPLPGDPAAGASPAPGDPAAGASPLPGDPAAGASPAPGDPAAGASPAPVAGASPAPVAGGDVATANPAIVGNDQLLQAGAYQFGFSGRSNVATGSYGGATPSRGRYLIALTTFRNTSGGPQQIPDGFFVVKDAQGRVYDFNRAASVEYFNRYPGAGDYPADAQIPSADFLVSVPLLFDVAPDATNLVMFSRDNTSQGFLVRPSAQ